MLLRQALRSQRLQLPMEPLPQFLIGQKHWPINLHMPAAKRFAIPPVTILHMKNSLESAPPCEDARLRQPIRADAGEPLCGRVLPGPFDRRPPHIQGEQAPAIPGQAGMHLQLAPAPFRVRHEHEKSHAFPVHHRLQENAPNLNPGGNCVRQLLRHRIIESRLPQFRVRKYRVQISQVLAPLNCNFLYHSLVLLFPYLHFRRFPLFQKPFIDMASSRVPISEPGCDG